MRRCSAFVVALLFALGCAGEPPADPAQGFGVHPALPPPQTSVVPTMKVPRARGWSDGEVPVAAPGFEVQRFAAGLEHPRWLYVLPNGDVLVAETAGPPTSDGGVRGWVMRRVLSRAGAGVPSANRITLLRDADGDGVAELQTPFATGLNSPFGMALVGDHLYVANTDAVVRLPYRAAATRAEGPAESVAPLPAGPINHHWTKNLIRTPESDSEVRLYVTVGSNSNVAENGIEQERGRALILELDPATGRLREFATGLRNPNGLAWQPATGVLWTVVNERDELGDDLVPDYLTSVAEGAFYGWPYSYYGAHVDSRVEPQAPELVARATVPDYALGSHTAALGLAFYDGELFAPRYAEGAFIGLHGSWNRSELSGYKVIFVPFAGGRPAGPPEDVLAGFVGADGKETRGRPVGVAVDKTGGLLVADDVGNTIWRVIPRGASAAGGAVPRAGAGTRAANP
jgi:glucose/arabinose dehydrogenase